MCRLKLVRLKAMAVLRTEKVTDFQPFVVRATAAAIARYESS